MKFLAALFPVEEQPVADWEVSSLLADLDACRGHFRRKGAAAAFDHFDWLMLAVDGEWRNHQQSFNS